LHVSEIQQIEGRLSGAGKRFAVVASRFNGSVVERLVDGALDCLRRHGVEEGSIRVVRVPGAWELPAAAQALAVAGDVDALVALGVVVRGETPHFDYVCGQASAGLQRVGLDHHLPVGFGLLTCDTPSQAQERAGGKAGNKGWEAALAALEMADLLARLGRPRA
jgi:6,7-dimethyl-8-ribityllumazine synthase